VSDQLQAAAALPPE